MKDNLNKLILSFGLIKLLIHLLTNTNYGLHRDEFLYIDEGKNLAWGFMEVPPFTPLLAKIADLLGGSVFVLKLFPALIGALIVIVSGLLVKELGGKKWALIFTCSALVLSPALLSSNTLFQPVSFNQFFWFLSAYWVVKIIQTKNNIYWLFLGLTAGVAFQNKYSIIFYIVGLFLAILVSQHRKLLVSKYPYIAFGIAFLIALPNIIWQANHHLPVMAHMQDLSQSQLIHVDWFHYLKSQLTFHFASSLVWMAGFIGLFFLDKLKTYRFVGIALLLTVLIIGSLSGKNYYTAGAYLIMFSFGGIVLEKIFHKKWMQYGSIALLLIVTLIFLPYSLPVLKIDKMKKYCAYMRDHFGLVSELRWEDGKYYALPQDMADMNGWEEMAQKVASLYHGLPEEKKENCLIYGGGYAHASSLNFYRKKYDLPRVHSFNSSYIIWAPTAVKFDNQIMIDDVLQTSSNWFENMVLVDSIQDPYAREKGYIYYRENPKIDVSEAWKNVVMERKMEYNFK